MKRKWSLTGSWLRRLSGAILAAAGLGIACGWFYSLAPMRRLADPRWLETHSEKARWLEEQKDYDRLGSSPDLEFRGDRVGYYGDKKWILWLVNKATTDENFRVCGCTETALALMCNQSADSWGDWLKTNGDRTQEEWIRDGFLKYGVSVHAPATPDDVQSLLRLIGQKSWNFLAAGPQGTNAPDAIPSYVQYNAFRWLRDSGFKPLGFARSNATLIVSEEMTLALLKYDNWARAFPSAKNDHLGVLAFGAEPQAQDGFAPPWIARPWVSFAVVGLLASLFIGGVRLCLKRSREVPTAAG